MGRSSCEVPGSRAGRGAYRPHTSCTWAASPFSSSGRTRGAGAHGIENPHLAGLPWSHIQEGHTCCTCFWAGWNPAVPFRTDGGQGPTPGDSWDPSRGGKATSSSGPQLPGPSSSPQLRGLLSPSRAPEPRPHDQQRPWPPASRLMRTGVGARARASAFLLTWWPVEASVGIRVPPGPQPRGAAGYSPRSAPGAGPPEGERTATAVSTWPPWTVPMEEAGVVS